MASTGAVAYAPAPTPAERFEETIGEHRYAATCRHEHDGITVSTGSGQKFAVLHASPAHVLRRLLLIELVNEGKAEPLAA